MIIVKDEDVWAIWEAMHRIVDPGEYGLGKEEGSYSEVDPPDFSKHPEMLPWYEQNVVAWTRIGELLDKMGEELMKGEQS